MVRRIAVVIVAVLSVASQAAAQDQWGVNVALTPSWESGPVVKQLFSADRVDMQGSEVRVGFVRGLELSGDWGISFVNTASPTIPRSMSTSHPAAEAAVERFCERSGEPA